MRRIELLVVLVAMLVSSGAALAQQVPAPTLADCNASSFQTVLRAVPPESALNARAIWFDARLLRWPQMTSNGARFRLHHSADAQISATVGSSVRGADGAIELDVFTGSIASSLRDRFQYVGDGVTLQVGAADVDRLDDLHRGQLVLVKEDAQGRVLDATRLQVAGAVDALHADAAQANELGVHLSRGSTTFALWAPTAQRVWSCQFESDRSIADALLSMQRDARSGTWSATDKQDRRGHYYVYLVDVFVPGVGIVRNRVSDPYAVSLGSNGQRAYIADLDAGTLKPPAWDAKRAMPILASATDMTIYELHVRDFSATDNSVPPAHQGKYLAFTDIQSHGMRHLAALADAGISDVHLLPVFDFATVPESGCSTSQPSGAPDGESQQATVEAGKSTDCFNWGYDPLHFNAPEGSYSSDASDGARRIVEFRAMVQSLHAIGLRVGMDVVYNHTSASGQNANAVLDRIVPGYYHRLNANGDVETSTCCANTATENAMMAKLMIDSVALWARQYHIDSFRFDLMGHQPRAVMERVQVAADAAAGRHVQLLGEGWNFGEVANGARFVQASQLSLNGSGIGTFSDRARDAVRGGGAGDNGVDQMRRQGYINGLFYDANAVAGSQYRASDLMQAADMVRVGLAGSIRSYRMRNYQNVDIALEQMVYGGSQPAGYVSEPGEVVNYIENHDNQTLFDINAFKLPIATTSSDRARVQLLGAAINAFSQGIAYFHAGIDTLRSKSMDRNSYDSGDWFNRVDWTYADNFFGTGLPPRQDNQSSWSLMRPLLADPHIKPTAVEIAWTRDAFRDLLRIRASSTLFRLRSAADIKSRLAMANTGSAQIPTVLAAHLDGAGYDGANFRELIYLINVDKVAHVLTIATEADKVYVLHPVHLDPAAADHRPVDAAHYDTASGAFTVPARTALVYVVEQNDQQP